LKKTNLSIILLSILTPFITSSSPLAHPLTLRECIEQALRKNEGMLTAQANFRSAKAGILGAWSAFLPHLSSSFGYTRSGWGPREELSFDPTTLSVITQYESGATSNYSMDLYLSQSIYNGGYNLANLKYQRANRRWYEEMLKFTKASLVWEVKQRYYDLLKAKRLLRVREDAVKRSEEQVKKAENLHRLGSVTISDVLKAKVQLGRDKLALIDTQNQLKQARSRLNQTLGLPLNSPLEAVDNLEEAGEDVDYEEMTASALEDHPEIQMAKAGIDRAKGSLSMAKGGRLPKVSLSGGYSWQDEKASEVKNVFDQDYTWNIMGIVTLPLFDGLSTKANIREAQEGLISAQLNLRQTQRNVELDIQQALLDLAKARESLEVTKESLSAAGEDLRLAQEKYKLGSVTMLEVLDAQASYSSTQASWVEALSAYRLAQAEIERALGLSLY
jgi:outer membrane protein